MFKVIQYNRESGVPPNHWKLMKIDCFGEMGGTPYKDEIKFHSKHKEELITYCIANNINLQAGDGWNEWFIQKPREERQ